LIRSEAVLGLPGYKVTDIDQRAGTVRITAQQTAAIACPHCAGNDLRLKDKRIRRPRQESWGQRHTHIELESRKWLCRGCGRSFWERFPGLLPRKRATEAFRRSVFQKHCDGINRSLLAQREGIGSATVERWNLDFLKRKASERQRMLCPAILGIDEHFFTRRQGYATTFCDLKGRKVVDVVLGRSEASLSGYLEKLEGKQAVRIVCMDLSTVYRAIARKHFPNAMIVADRFHVIRLINHHFLTCWREIDPVASKHRGLVSLMRRHRHHLKPEQRERLEKYLEEHPLLQLIYRFKQKLCYLLLKKHRTKKQCARLAPRLTAAIRHLQEFPLAPLKQLGETLASWSEEIARMWRFTRSNGITEGFHTKMEVLQRQAYGFRNFANYRLRVRALCG
jgi:transposase